jgi:N-methylhydantoinase A
MQACIVPPNPGNLSALGLLAVDWRTDHIVTRVMHEDAIDSASVAALYSDLESDAAATLKADGIDPERIRIVREADVRYSGQSMEVKSPRRAGTVDGSFLDGLIQGFHAAHLRTFGYTMPASRRSSWSDFASPALA